MKKYHSIPEEKRQAAVKMISDGYTQLETAKACGIGVSTVHRIVSRGNLNDKPSVNKKLPGELLRQLNYLHERYGKKETEWVSTLDDLPLRQKMCARVSVNVLVRLVDGTEAVAYYTDDDCRWHNYNTGRLIPDGKVYAWRSLLEGERGCNL